MTESETLAPEVQKVLSAALALIDAEPVGSTTNLEVAEKTGYELDTVNAALEVLGDKHLDLKPQGDGVTIRIWKDQISDPK